MLNHSIKPPKEIAVVEMNDAGKVTIVRGSPSMQKAFDHGLLDYPNRKPVKPDDGPRFMDVMLVEFSGTYIRAEES